MNVGLFGGTFDPIHRGHLAVARAAQKRFKLAHILFVPASTPPHKQSLQITPYAHRYAMTVLAISDEKSFIPSDIESPERLSGKPSYTVDTVARIKAQLTSNDRLFLLIGMDAFKDIAKWREPETLLRETEFIVMARPGFSLKEIEPSLPASMRAAPTASRRAPKADIPLPGATLHLLPDVHEKISATQIRAAARSGGKLEALVGTAVADYIRKTGLYKDSIRTTAGTGRSSQEIAARRRK